MVLTNDQYTAKSTLSRWYKRASHQFIEISGVVGTGVNLLVRDFLDDFEFDSREIMYLSFDQKQVLELAAKQCHAYYLPGFVYKYDRVVNFDTLSVINPRSTQMEYKWVKSVRKHVDGKYKLIIIFDSTLLNYQMIMDISSFDLPVILLRDPALMPAPDSYTFVRDPNIELRELHPELIKNPITYFANKVLYGNKVEYGNYDTVSVVPRKHLNLYNLKSSDMTITMGNEMSDTVNKLYRERVLHVRRDVNVVNERLIVMEDMHAHKLINGDEKRIKIYLSRGLVGYLSKCNRHAPITRYVPVEFKTDFYHEPFDDLVLDRNYLNRSNTQSRQIIPNEVFKCRYAYALPVALARTNHWDKVTLIVDPYEADEFVVDRMIYTAITRCRRSMTIVL